LEVVDGPLPSERRHVHTIADSAPTEQASMAAMPTRWFDRR
jgi:hypothetical protein